MKEGSATGGPGVRDKELGEFSKNVSSQGRFRASGGDFVTYTYNSVTDAKDNLWGPLRFVFTTTVVCSNGRQVVVVIDFFTFKKPSTGNGAGTGTGIGLVIER